MSNNEKIQPFKADTPYHLGDKMRVGKDILQATLSTNLCDGCYFKTKPMSVCAHVYCGAYMIYKKIGKVKEENNG